MYNVRACMCVQCTHRTLPYALHTTKKKQQLTTYWISLIKCVYNSFILNLIKIKIKPNLFSSLEQ